MSIRIGIYDFFSFLFPGGVFIALFLYLVDKYEIYSINIKDLSTIEIIAFGALAYLVGFIVDPIASRTWWRLFHREKFLEKIMSDFNERHPTIEVKFQEMDSYIFLSYVRRHGTEMADESEQLNAKSIMLRNLSFGLFVFSVVFGIEFFINAYQPSYIVYCVLCLLCSIILGQEAVKYRRWFFQSIYQATIALLAKSKNLPVVFETKDNRHEKK